jgi:hypothetical protein
VPFVAGTLLWTGATALLLEDAVRSAHLTVANALMPVLTLGTVCAAVFAHRSLGAWRPISGVLFVFLAVLGSLATVYGTLGRQAEVRDHKQADAMAENRTLGLKEEELVQAKALAKKECITIGPRCQQWQVRVDTLTREMSSLRAVAVDPRADAIQRIATLVGLDGDHIRAIVQAIDPLVLPLFLEFGSIVFFAAAFPMQRITIAQPLQPVTETIAQPLQHSARVFTKEEARQDLKRLREAGSGRYLAARWGRDPATVSRWLAEWAENGTIARERQGKSKRALTVIGT